MRKRVVFIVGPTAIGKSELAVKLAQEIGAEIISCDSMQVYKGMDILSAKPSKLLRNKIPHYLIDIKSARNEYDCVQYQKDVQNAIGIIQNKGKIPLIVGGTGFYMSVLLDGIFKGSGKNKKFRERLYKEAEQIGSQKLYLRLKKIDEKCAEKIHPNDLRRIIRALEVIKSSATAISKLQKKRRGILDDFDVRIFGLRQDREMLYNRIDKRVDTMFKKGLIKEVKSLLKQKINNTAAQVIGIKEIKGFLAGEYDLAEAKRLIKRNSRHYAKRQFTWFKRDNRIQWIDIDNKKETEIVKEIINKI